MSDEEKRETHKAANSAVIGVLAASLLFFPSVYSSMEKPIEAPYLFVGYISLVILSIIVLLSSLYHSNFAKSGVAIIRTGLGNCAGFLGLILFAAFSIVNIVADLYGNPTISALTGSGSPLCPGELVTLSAEYESADPTNINWKWRIAELSQDGEKLREHQIDNYSHTLHYRLSNIRWARYLVASTDAEDRNGRSEQRTIRIPIGNCDG